MIDCNDSCKASVLDMEAALQQIWSHLPISNRWRCPACTAALNSAASLVGPDLNSQPDLLPPHSRGALPKATAHTISPVSVSGNLR